MNINITEKGEKVDFDDLPYGCLFIESQDSPHIMIKTTDGDGIRLTDGVVVDDFNAMAVIDVTDKYELVSK